MGSWQQLHRHVTCVRGLGTCNGAHIPQGDRASGGQGTTGASVVLKYLIGGEVKNLTFKHYKSQSFKIEINRAI